MRYIGEDSETLVEIGIEKIPTCCLLGGLKRNKFKPTSIRSNFVGLNSFLFEIFYKRVEFSILFIYLFIYLFIISMVPTTLRFLT
jgi:hypothetical protein